MELTFCRYLWIESTPKDGRERRFRRPEVAAAVPATTWVMAGTTRGAIVNGATAPVISGSSAKGAKRAKRPVKLTGKKQTNKYVDDNITSD